ncbi:methyltransferase domain-containing protein [Pseudodesulfovibrio alkaliphilus]|uniref:methyltransferase domain-containing protein n=1 Tax=Pseudodesulfovibrio alkaliphilus TaxID=2661613 RepID=UPI0018C89CBD|nr:methyltransferase domain-containing protein [Pseudodesulfovibrio alkaliphilus]
MSKESIRRAFERARNTYANAAQLQDRVARRCAGHVPPGDYPAILEIGAGCGVLTRHIAPRCAHSRYVAVDISPGMLDQVSKHGLTNPELVVADGERLLMPPESFDLLVSSSTMQWYRSPEVSIRENLGLLRGGGRFAFSIFVDGTYAEFAEASAASGFGSMLPMRSVGYFMKILYDAAPTALEFEAVTHTAHYPTVADMLRTHRATGATATPGAKRPSRLAYQRFIDHYESNHRAPEGVRSTAVVLHVWGRR